MSPAHLAFVNSASEWRRKQAATRTESLVPEDVATVRAGEQSPIVSELASPVGKLPNAHREPLALRVACRLPNQKLAELLLCSERVSRARARLSDARGRLFDWPTQRRALSRPRLSDLQV